MNPDEAREFYRKQCVYESIIIPPTGGQSCGMTYSGQRLKCEELDLVIETGFNRSQLANRKLLSVMFEAFLTDILK